jgi:hypothetical protein
LDSEQVAQKELIVHIASYHTSRDENLNERNYGLGLRMPIRERVFATAGFYRNSLDRESVYLGAGWWLLEKGPMSLRVLVGAVTGYQVAVAPVVIPEAAIGARAWRVAFSYVPEIKLDEGGVNHVFTFSVIRRF